MISKCLASRGTRINLILLVPKRWKTILKFNLKMTCSPLKLECWLSYRRLIFGRTIIKIPILVTKRRLLIPFLLCCELKEFSLWTRLGTVYLTKYLLRVSFICQHGPVKRIFLRFLVATENFPFHVWAKICEHMLTTSILVTMPWMHCCEGLSTSSSKLVNKWTSESNTRVSQFK